MTEKSEKAKSKDDTSDSDKFYKDFIAIGGASFATINHCYDWMKTSIESLNVKRKLHSELERFLMD